MTPEVTKSGIQMIENVFVILENSSMFLLIMLIKKMYFFIKKLREIETLINFEIIN